MTRDAENSDSEAPRPEERGFSAELSRNHHVDPPSPSLRRGRLAILASRRGSTQPRFPIVFSITILLALAACLVVFFPSECANTFTRFKSLLKHEKSHSPISKASPLPLDPLLFNGKRALAETAAFIGVASPRCSGTDGAERAAKHIASRLESIGLTPIMDEFKDNTPAGEKTFRNVMGELPGSTDNLIVLASHYDTKSGISTNFAGANDSGSSTGLLLEMARILKQSATLGTTILFAFLDGEECMSDYSRSDGLHGSKRLARTLVKNMRVHKVVAVIVVDMIGDSNLNVTIPRNSTPLLTSMVFESANEENARLKFALDDQNILDDHVPFAQAGMRAIDIIDFDYGSEPGKNDYWHTDKDTLDKLNDESLQITGRVVIRTLNKLRNTSPMMKITGKK